MHKLVRKIAQRYLVPIVSDLFFTALIMKSRNFAGVRWMGYPIWQNILDLWTIQEIICEVKPSLLIECGTNKGGSARFYAHLFDLLGQGEVVTIDVEKLHDLSHPRITFLIGSSVEASVYEQVKAKVEVCDGPIMVILDSDHSERHVRKELDLYAPLVTKGSYCLVQDGVIDTLRYFKAGRPGPLPAILSFTAEHKEFEIREELSERFLLTHHPKGWLRRVT